jgi:hypothetical protein
MILELIERLTEEAAKRDMDFLLIGGQAIGVLGHQRMTMDIDFLVLASKKSGWAELLAHYGYCCFSEGRGFAQFEGKPGWPRVDLMLVDDVTFAKLRADAFETRGKRTPSPQHMVALKLHAARSNERDPEKSNQDWFDIRKLIELHQLDPENEAFASLILRYGGNEALERIRQMCQS